MLHQKLIGTNKIKLATKYPREKMEDFGIFINLLGFRVCLDFLKSIIAPLIRKLKVI